MGTLDGAPQAYRKVISLFVVFQKSVVLERDVTGLKVGIPGAGLGRDQAVHADAHDDPVDIGKLAACGIDPVIEGIAHEHEPLGRRPCRVQPRMQRRHVGVIEGIHAVSGVVEGRPIHVLGFARAPLQYCRVRVAGVKLFHIVGRAIDEERPGVRNCGQEVGIGKGPGITDGPLVDYFETRRLLVGKQPFVWTEWRQLLIHRHILPIIAKVLGRKGMSVGPAMTLAENEREFPPLADIETLQDVRDELQVPVIGHQPRVAVDRHQFGVSRLGHEEAQIAAVAAKTSPLAVQGGDGWRLGNALANRRQFPGDNVIAEPWRFQKGRFRPASAVRETPDNDQEQKNERAPEGEHHTRAAPSASAEARTKWSSSTSIKSSDEDPLSVNGLGQAVGFDILLSMSASKSRRRLKLA